MGTQARDIAAREAKLEALQNKLTASVGALVSGDDWKRALSFAAQFRARSFNNTMLIAVQHYAAFQEGRVPAPMPTYVAGFRQWQSLSRAVMKGQSGYAILAPVTARFASANPSDPDSWRRLARGETPHSGDIVRSKLVGLKPAHVWDVSQTDGKPIPETPRPTLLQGQAPDGLWDGLADQITAQGFELRLVSNATSIGGANGLTDYATREVSVRMDMDDAAQAKTLAHELGHVLLHDPTQPEASADAAMHRGIAEVEAESVALMVGAAHGLATDDYTIPYVASWASSVPGKTPAEVVQSTAERVRSTAVRILDQLDTPQISDGNPPGLDRSGPAHERGATATRAATPQQIETVGR
ncbi:MAG: serine/arginine repetitive matrix protein 2 [Nocardioides sp.]|uniref:ImmA/IrrE family metallo-endopeptidase n=1 Tax=Nocardioides sp. TaxID=35761 RepID=UPI0039E4BD3D